MTTNRSATSDRFPPPYRAPAGLEESTSWPDDGRLTEGPGPRRYERAIDGWIATRIRKQTRHWRQR